MRSLLCTLILVTIAGCGSGTPDIAAVKEQMASEQSALGDPLMNSVGMVLVPVPAGEFRMGTAVNDDPLETRYEKLVKEPEVQKKLESGEVTKEDLLEHVKREIGKDKQRRTGPESPQHLVKITQPYYLGVCEVTQQQYEAVMGAKPWSGQPLVEGGPDYAATYISWEKANEFCIKLSEQENVLYRLPTEAEWEYACRAGSTTVYSFGDEREKLTEHAWYDVNAYKAGEQYAHAVGQKLPNAWAMYDMHGNAWEWCSDWYGGYDKKKKEAVDPTGPEKGRYRVWRGGSFAEAPDNMRSASRVSYGRANYRPEYIAGFRVVRMISP